MVAPIVAKIGIQAGISVIKKYPWLIPVIVAVILIPTIFTFLGVYSVATGVTSSFSSNQSSKCSKEYSDTLNGIFNNDQIIKGSLEQSCPAGPAGAGPSGPFGDVDDSAFSTVGTTVSPEVKALATSLMADFAAGKLTSGYFGGQNDHIKEIQYLADGQAVIGCGIDYRVLQIVKIAVDTFGTAGISDLNRRCTGQIEGAGVLSAHYANGGGHAVDFYQLGGSGLNGVDSGTLQFLSVLDSRVPHNTYVGQSDCGMSRGPYASFYQFDDTCNHMHIDFRAADLVAVK